MTTFNRTNRTRRAAVGFAIAAAALTIPLALTGCANSAPDSSKTGTDSAASEHGTTKESPIMASDAWAKASADDAAHGEGMTGVFADLMNHGDEDLTIRSLKSDAAGIVELHEVVDGKMRAIQGDVVIPAGSTFKLEPGANHIMLMDMTKQLLPGDEVTITLEFSDGSSFDLVALVKDTSGANESYEDIEGESDDHTDDGTHAGH